MKVRLLAAVASLAALFVAASTAPAHAQIITESTGTASPPGVAPVVKPKPRKRRPKPKPTNTFLVPKLLWKTLLRPSPATPVVTTDGIFVTSGTFLFQLDPGGRTLSFAEIGASAAPAAADDNRIYVGTNRGSVYAIDRHTGHQLWKSAGASDTILTTPAIGDGRVYIESNDNYVYALAALTGGAIWKFLRPDGSLGYSSPIFFNGALYVCGDSTVYRLEPSTGKQTWHTPVGGKSLSTPFVDDQRLYVGADGSGLTALALADGHQVWSFGGKSGKEWFGAPIVAAGVVYATDDSRDVYALDAATGKVKWTLRLLTSSLSQPALDPKTHILYVASMTNGDNPTLTAIDSVTGKKVWEDKLGNITGSPVIDGNNLYVAASNGYFYCFSLSGK